MQRIVNRRVALSFDLIMATRGRTLEPRRLLESLVSQTHGTFRLIVVDQKCDGRFTPIVAEYGLALSIVHLRSEPGLSRARNVGLEQVVGDVVAFPDDDCWYASDLLERVAAFFTAHPEWDGLSARSTDEAGHNSVTRWDAKPGTITRRNVWKRANSVSIFLRREVVEVTGAFDEAIGVGAETLWGASEEIDYLLRGLALGHAFYFDPDFHVYHRRAREEEAQPDREVGYRYGAGMGRVLRKNRSPWWFALYHVLRAFGGAAVSFGRGQPAKARFYLAVGMGRVRGWRSRTTAS